MVETFNNLAIHLLLFSPKKSFHFVKYSKRRKLLRWSSPSLRIIQFPPNLPKKVTFFRTSLMPLLFFVISMPVLMIWFLLFVFVDSKTSATSEDEENLVPKTTAKKVGAETVPCHLFRHSCLCFSMYDGVFISRVILIKIFHFAAYNRAGSKKHNLLPRRPELSL